MRLWKWAYLVLVVGGMGLATLLLIIGLLLLGSSHMDEAAPFVLAAVPLPFFPATIAILVLFYKMWAAIQDGHARTTPEKAVLLLFIPVFNFYWIVQVTYGWAKDYNAYIARHGLTSVPNMPEGLFLAYVVLIFASVLVLPALILFVVLLAVIWKICDGVNALPASPPAAPTPTPTPS